MNVSSTQTLAYGFAAYALWRIYRLVFRSSTLANVAGPPNASWFKGNVDQLFNRNAWSFHRELTEKYGSVAKFYGPLGNEGLYVMDPLALHHIILKEQDSFEEPSFMLMGVQLAFGDCLLSALGDVHRRQRKMLNPVFSLKHMRGLVSIFFPLAHHLSDIIANKVKTSDADIDIHQWMSRAALEYIGQAGLGHSFDAMDENKTNEYNEAAKLLLPLGTQPGLALFRTMTPFLTKFGSPAFRRKVLEWIPWPDLQKVKEIVDIMDINTRTVLDQKRDALAKGDEYLKSQVGEGKDIMSILLRANTMSDAANRLPESEVLGQMNLLVFAGHDTTTNALSRILHQLALNPAVQDRLRDEVIKATKEHGDLDYDTLMGLPYLDAICRETLRLFPPASFLNRTLKKDYILPLLWPVMATDGKTEIKEIPLKKNTEIIVSVLNANRSKAIWGEDADEWKPERWLSELPESVFAAHLPGVYSHMMTFLGGSRACIGFKFSELEMKVVLTVLLNRFVFRPSSREIYWNLSGIAFPGLAGSESSTPELPMRVELLKGQEA